MSINFPTAIDSFTNPAAGDQVSVVNHALQHDNANDAIIALETKMGINSSLVTSTIDYLLKNTSSIDPGHKHTEASINTSDLTTNDVSSTKHGFAPKSPADATKFLNGAATPAYALVKDSDLATTDVTTNNVVSTKHGFAPKSPSDATQFLNGAATPAYAAVKDSDLSTSDVTTNDASTSKHGFMKKLPNDNTKFYDGTGAFSVPVTTSATFPTQEIPVQTTTLSPGVFIMTSNTTGTVIYVAVSAPGTDVNIYRMAKDTNTGNYYITHTVGLSGGTVTASGMAVLGSSLYVSFAGGNLIRYAAADLTSRTAMSFSGTSRNGIMWADGTNLWIYNGTSSQFDKFTISGSTATNTGATTFTTSGVVKAAISDNTSVWITDGTGDATYTYRKYPVAGGASSSSVSIIENPGAFNGSSTNVQLFMATSAALGKGIAYNSSSATAVIGQILHLAAVTLP